MCPVYSRVRDSNGDKLRSGEISIFPLRHEADENESDDGLVSISPRDIIQTSEFVCHCFEIRSLVGTQNYLRNKIPSLKS